MHNIIVVDDDITNVQLLQMLLELEGYVVSPCTSIEEAVAATKANTKAYVIDWHLERNSSGLDLLNAVRAGGTSANKNAIVIMTSGDHRKENEALNAGANTFLLKPYPPDELSSVLSDLLAEGDGSG